MKRLLRTVFLWIPLCFIGVSIVLVLFFKWAPVRVTPLMVVRTFQGTETVGNVFRKKWTPIGDISPDLIRCVLASEDARFFMHRGFDFEELRKMEENHRKYGKAIRGCSTVSQQTAKNCFTWCTRTMVRKGFEAYYTLLIERIWGKKRILEVYLNVAELGPGIYGVQEAAEEYFHKNASKLSLSESASLTCCLPNPLKRSPEWVGRHMSTRRSQIIALSHDVILDFDKKESK